jgi:AraC family transcriptional regulator of adaptative response / DNA-3-methyladenine glycosylase II
VQQIAEKNQLAVEISPSLAPVLPQVLARLRSLFDVDARPDVIAAHLAVDPRLAPSVRREPGLRVPGCFDAFELAWRAVLGQQVSVRGASTLAARLAERFGEPITTPLPCLNRLTPTPETISAARTGEIAGIGLPAARAETLRGLAAAVKSGAGSFEPGVDPIATEQLLTKLAGIGPWTAAYIAMRGLHWPDAFPVGDLGLVKASGLAKRDLANEAEAWRPWRAYAAMHLWESLHHTAARSKSP